ncbi:hypothetical protein [Mesorhizobium sp. CAU 1741]|uniref:hypothetical protein n=1 Tax=Mesorhizobium sp. CAU 1741 TaxID=3140366 RepID=UPI00325A6475
MTTDAHNAATAEFVQDLAARFLDECHQRGVDNKNKVLAMHALLQVIRHSISSAGYHLLSEADLAARDNAVLERAAVVAESLADDWVGENGGAACLAAAASIRAMQGGKP